MEASEGGISENGKFTFSKIKVEGIDSILKNEFDSNLKWV